MNASLTHVTDQARKDANRRDHEAEEARLAKIASDDGMKEPEVVHPGDGAD